MAQINLKINNKAISNYYYIIATFYHSILGMMVIQLKLFIYYVRQIVSRAQNEIAFLIHF